MWGTWGRVAFGCVRRVVRHRASLVGAGAGAPCDGSAWRAHRAYAWWARAFGGRVQLMHANSPNRSARNTFRLYVSESVTKF